MRIRIARAPAKHSGKCSAPNATSSSVGSCAWTAAPLTYTSGAPSWRTGPSIVRETEIDGLLTNASSTLASDRGFGLVWIGVRDPDGTLRLWQTPSGQASGAEEWHRLFERLGTVPPDGTERRDDGVWVTRDLRSALPDAPDTGTIPPENDAFLHTSFRHGQVEGFLAATVDPGMADDEEEFHLFVEIAGDIAHAVASIRTRAQREEAFRQLEKAKEEAEKANKVKEEFLAVMSHEMRTPLNPILGYCELLEDSLQNTEDLHSVNQIQDAATHLLGLIDEILFFTNLHGGTETVDKVTFRVSDCCEEALADAPAPKIGVSLGFDRNLRGAEPVPRDLRVRADRAKWRRIIGNLLSNACKYTRQGWIRLHVGLEREGADTTYLVARVEDTGMGIDPDDVDDLFEPFTQADYSYARSASAWPPARNLPI